MKYDYDTTDKRKLIVKDKKAKTVQLILPWTLSDMGRLGFLTGDAQKDYERTEWGKSGTD